MMFSEMANTDGVDISKAESMILKKGEFFLFNEKTLHQSNPNLSNRRRMALAVRVTIPLVKVYHEKLFKSHRNIMLAGENSHDINQMGLPPEGPGIASL